MGLFVYRKNPDGSKRGMVCRGRIPGDATPAEAIEDLVVFAVLIGAAALLRYLGG